MLRSADGDALVASRRLYPYVFLGSQLAGPPDVPAEIEVDRRDQHRAMLEPTRAHTPDAVGSVVPACGRRGQNTQRPQMTSRAGSRVIITSKPTATPMAATGPRPDVEFISAKTRQSIPSTTVPALATMAGPARCSAMAIA